MSKKNILIICGGKSAEHLVSVISARNVIKSMNKEKYDIILVGIDMNGSWYKYKSCDALTTDSIEMVEKGDNNEEIILIPGKKDPLHTLSESMGNIDAVFPVLHGTFGEDGCIQGLLNMLNLPFVGPDVIGSSLAMDKDIVKKILSDSGIYNADYIVVRKEDRTNIDISTIIKKLSLPLFIKPANLGSSIGISKASSEKELITAIDLALEFDAKIIIEECIVGREIECAVLGNEYPKASLPGEVILHDEFYAYDTKYVSENGATLVVPAELNKDLIKKIQEKAIFVYKLIECKGMARVDFFITKDEKLYINEVNTIPGFTSISMYPSMWKASGLPYSQLIDRLLELAIERFELKSSLRTTM